ncbi:cobalt transporter [Massilia sp. Root133]|jgi:cobalt-zinc-cadmium efflux system protein|uniref:Cation diffusion facilitator family transporter n=1 Tax=Massilia cellulosiltytica TaxID=2683234 RepID=A0A7X3K8F5_9BURK|nr:MULTISPECIES: cation diffusion facilitator family transporter [Telluria group]KQY16595.1 cobalt transporter [Massilia sp. Root133]MVW61442.1 cation diffusion facilitator family transporter [Telluria cellulosilytica]
MSHHHSHGHGHGHHHHPTPGDNGRAFGIAIGLNTAFVAIEFIYGFIANSTALMADAGHNLSDVLGLGLAWGAALLTKSAPTRRFTYGMRGTTILAALANALLLMVACGAIAWEAVHRFAHPEPVAGTTVSIVAFVGVLINGFSAWLFVAGSKDDINVRGAYQHMAADALLSLGVVISGVVIIYTGWSWLDPVVSLVLVVVIVVGTWSLLRESIQMVLAGVPASVDATGVTAYLAAQPGVTEVHDVHIWAMSTTETALTAHLVMPDGYPGDTAIDSIVEHLREYFSIHHCTLQVEQGTTKHRTCSLHDGLEAHAHDDHDHNHDHDHPHGHSHAH